MDHDSIDPDRPPLEFDDGALPTCESCGAAMGESFYRVEGHACCEACSAAIYDRYLGGKPWPRAFGATLLGAGGAFLGFLAYYAIWRLARRQFSLVAVLVGFLAGRGVSLGSRGRGGWPYQMLAMGLTYTAIVSTYIPQVVAILAMNPAAARNAPGRGANAAFVAPRPRPDPIRRLQRGVIRAAFVLMIAYLVPILMAIQQPFTLLVVGVGLWEAWKLNRRRTVRIDGPFYFDEMEIDPVPGLA